MAATQDRLILWTGEKHCGKTTSAADLAQVAREEGFDVAGVLAPSIYNNGRLVGFDAIDLRNEERTPLARRQPDSATARPFTFFVDGLRHGNTALGPMATKSADLVVVDEFGPLEFDGGGWRRSVDLLFASSSSLILLVVRQELAGAVRQLYADVPCRRLAAIEPESIRTVIRVLKDRRQSH